MNFKKNVSLRFNEVIKQRNKKYISSKIEDTKFSRITPPIDLIRSKDNSDKDHETKLYKVNVKSKIIIATFIILGIISKLLLLRQNVEPNPGPQDSKDPRKPTLSIIMYNCNGLGNVQKLKRV